MKINLLSEQEMRDIGFTEHRKDNWYFCRAITQDITFNLSMKKDGKTFKIDVLDEDFCQPYDYQYYLSKTPNSEFALNVKKKVETIMLELCDRGIITEYEVGDYI